MKSPSTTCTGTAQNLRLAGDCGALPPEIVSLLFSYAIPSAENIVPSLLQKRPSAWSITRKWMMSWMRVDRVWESVVIPNLYFRIHLEQPEQLVLLLQTVKESPDIARLIKHINMPWFIADSEWDEHLLTLKQQYFELLECCSSVVCFSISPEIGIRGTYMEQTIPAKFPPSFFNLTHLDLEQDFCILYSFDLIEHIKHSLQWLGLTLTLPHRCMLRGHESHTMPYPAIQLDSLHYLRINLTAYHPFIVLVELLVGCLKTPNLESLSFNCRILPPDPTEHPMMPGFPMTLIVTNPNSMLLVPVLKCLVGKALRFLEVHYFPTVSALHFDGRQLLREVLTLCPELIHLVCDITVTDEVLSHPKIQRVDVQVPYGKKNLNAIDRLRSSLRFPSLEEGGLRQIDQTLPAGSAYFLQNESHGTFNYSGTPLIVDSVGIFRSDELSFEIEEHSDDSSDEDFVFESSDDFSDYSSDDSFFISDDELDD
jgi:hypothetical protein